MSTSITYHQVIEKAAASDRFDRAKLGVVAELFGVEPADVALDVARKRGESFMKYIASIKNEPPQRDGFYEKSLKAAIRMVPKYSAETVADILAAIVGRGFDSVLDDIKRTT